MNTKQKPFPVQLHLTGSELLHALELIAPDAFKGNFDRHHPQLLNSIVIAKTEPPSNDLSISTHCVVEWSAVATLSAASAPVDVNATGEATSCSIELSNALAEIARLNTIINTPHADDFICAVSIEAEHQRQRWSEKGDAGKAPSDWFWLVGYLAGKALHEHAAGNVAKGEHHVITTAAACANWHRALFGKTDMRPGHKEGADRSVSSQPRAQS